MYTENPLCRKGRGRAPLNRAWSVGDVLPSLTKCGGLASVGAVMQKTGWEQFVEIITKPDNIPIVGLMFLVLYFTWLAFREGRKNDQLIEEGRADEILDEMQK